MQQLDQDARAEEDADALDDAGAEGGDEGDELERLGTLGGGEDPHGRLEAALAERKEPDNTLPVAMEMSLVEVAVAGVGEDVEHGPAAERQESGDHEVGHYLQDQVRPAIDLGQSQDVA